MRCPILRSAGILSAVFGSCLLGIVRVNLADLSASVEKLAAHMQEFAQLVRLKKKSTRRFTMLKDASGIIPPGRVCLLLGPPGPSLTHPSVEEPIIPPEKCIGKDESFGHICMCAAQDGYSQKTASALSVLPSGL